MSSYATRRRGARQAAAAGRQLDRDIAAAKAEREAKRAAHAKAYDEARKAEQPVAADVIDALRPLDLVRARDHFVWSGGGWVPLWYRVRWVNAKTVTVVNLWGEPVRIRRDRIVEVRQVAR